jgi:hypothetical protein
MLSAASTLLLATRYEVCSCSEYSAARHINLTFMQLYIQLQHQQAIIFTSSLTLCTENLAPFDGVAFPPIYTEFHALLSSTQTLILSESQLYAASSYTAMPASRRSQKKDRFVDDFTLACTFLSCAHLFSHSSHRDPGAASLPKKCSPIFFTHA